MSITLSALQQQRRDTAANWTSANPTLLAGEIGVETDTGLLKIGDGSTAWTSLDYLPLSFEGYAANGIYNPAANQVALATNGTGRLFIDSSGNIGVGTSSPGRNLVVNSGASSGYIQLVNTNSGTAASNGFELKLDSAGAIVDLINRENGAMRFFTNNTQQMQIDSSGNVGIGTTNPGALLTVGSTSDSNTNTTIASSTSGTGGLYFNDGSNSGALIYNHTNNFLQFRANGSERMRIDSSGNVGIGTTAPERALTVSANNPMVQIEATGGNGRQYSLVSVDDASGASLGSSGNFVIYDDSSGGGSRLTIDSSGNVGVGTSAPAELFTVNGTDKSAMIRTSNSTGTAKLKLNADDINFAGVGLENTALVFRCSNNSSPTERLRIDSSGRLLVGTSSSTKNSLLETNIHSVVTGDGSLGGAMFTAYCGTGSSTARSSVLGFQRSRGTTDGSMTLVSSGDRLGNVFFRGADGANFVDSASIQAFVDGTPGTNDMPGRLVFSTTADGDSSPTERMRIDKNGNITNCVGIYNNTTAAAANVFVGSAGDLGRSTSSAKYKTDIESIEDSYSDALLNCRPVWYRSTCEGDNPAHGWWGFIAEEVAAIDPRLVHWKTVEITYDDNGSAVRTPCDPEPEGVAYDRFVPHLLNLIKRQQAAIETLEQRLTDAGL